MSLISKANAMKRRVQKKKELAHLVNSLKFAKEKCIKLV